MLKGVVVHRETFGVSTIEKDLRATLGEVFLHSSESEGSLVSDTVQIILMLSFSIHRISLVAHRSVASES